MQEFIGHGTAAFRRSNLALFAAGVAVITFGFFGGHSIASSWVGRRAGAVGGLF